MRHLVANILRNIAQKIDPPTPDVIVYGAKGQIVWQGNLTDDHGLSNVYVDRDLRRWRYHDTA